jgi:hypothetical protein
MPRAVRQIRIDGDVAYIPLTGGHEAIIDAADVPLVSGMSWCAVIRKKRIYATTGASATRHHRYLHRLIMDAPAHLTVDHRDLNGLNNRRINLRLATAAENNRNMATRSDSTSGIKGVFWDKWRSKWKAEIAVNRVKRSLGYFPSKDDAASAYAKASAELHGEFGRTE